jgi:ATP-dependent DNA ligase
MKRSPERSVVFDSACEMRLEGIVSKRTGSPYQSGPSRNGLKTKNSAFVRT